MSTCNSCGGILGRDCFNPQECAWITQSMMVDDAVQRQIHSQHEEELKRQYEEEYGAFLQAQYSEHLASIGFDPIAMGM
jgi:hypothetical protein